MMHFIRMKTFEAMLVVVIMFVTTIPWPKIEDLSSVDAQDRRVSLQLLEPVLTTVAVHNQFPDSQRWAAGAGVPDHSVIASEQTRFSGRARGLINVFLVVGGKWIPTIIDENGDFSVSVDTTVLPSGPNVILVYGWDGPEGKFKTALNLRFDLWLENPAKLNMAPSVPEGVSRMQLVFEDHFDGQALDQSKWFAGPKPDGGQWGGAHFVADGEREFPDVYKVRNGYLTIRAHHNLDYVDPEKWGWKELGDKEPRQGRTWYSGQISSAFPDGRATGVRKGYFEVRAKLPNNQGAWSAPIWLLNVPSIPPGSGAVEIDIEAYGGSPSTFHPAIHDWAKSGQHRFETQTINTGQDLTLDFHVFGIWLTDTQVIWFLDGREMFRRPIYRADDRELGRFFALIDLAISYDFPVQPPPAGYIDLIVDYVRIYEG